MVGIGVRDMATRAVAGFLAIVFLTAGLPLTPAAAEVSTASSLDFELNGSHFGANEFIEIEFGLIEYYPICLGGGKPDFFYPVADVYVINGTDIPEALADVSGTPNTVIGLSGGLIAFELIGITAPGGTIGTGTYSVVIDECQNKKYDPDVDTVLSAAFTVEIPIDAPPPPAGIAAMKTDAADSETRWANAAEGYKRLFQLLGLLETLSPTSSMRNIVLGLVKDEILGAVKDSLGERLGAPLETKVADLVKGAAVGIMKSMSEHYKGIAADPPDPDHHLIAPLAWEDGPAGTTGDPVLDAQAELVRELVIEAALAEALLHTNERYQGADNDDSGLGALRQARHGAVLAALMQEQVLRTRAALLDVHDAMANDPRDLAGAFATFADARDAVRQGNLTDEDRALAWNLGFDDRFLRDLRAGYATEPATPTFQDLLGDLQAQAATYESLASTLENLSADYRAIAADLTANALVPALLPIADAGGPYGGDEGATITLDASASAPPAPGMALEYAWDLDHDGAFDDATGATVVHELGPEGRRLVGVQVTAATGYVATHYSVVESLPANAPPTIDAATPEGAEVEVLIGDTIVFEADATDPEGATITLEWQRNTTEVQHTGASYTWTPNATDAGAHQVFVAADDGSTLGGRTLHQWNVLVLHPDNEGDGYRANIDCDDNDPAVHPGAIDVLNGIDDDCDPSTPDGGTPPTLVNQGNRSYAEGDLIKLTSDPGSTPETASQVAWDHPDKGSASFTATVDWGDGNKGPATYDGSFLYASHRYADEGEYLIEVCMVHELGSKGCTEFDANVSNAAPNLNINDLHAWTPDNFPAGTTNYRWNVAPDGQSVVQEVNAEATLFVSNLPFGYGSAEAKIKVLQTGDDDFIGFAIGYQPGMNMDSDAQWWLVDWKQGNQSHCGLGTAGLALSRVQGVPTGCHLWAHTHAANGDGVHEVARAATLGHTGWLDQHEYSFVFEATPDRLRVWVDGVLEIDHQASFGPGSLTLYNYSQGDVQYRSINTTGVGTAEGRVTPIRAVFDDPGSDDTHLSRADFGDGSPTEGASIEADGDRFRLATTHTYLEDGAYDLEFCVEDNDGASNCTILPVTVANLAPVVDAGRDIVTNGHAVLAGATFADPGVLDTHNRTVDWGDGTSPDTITLESQLGKGTIPATHDYATPGIYHATVCVTDDEGATGCDSLEVNVTAPAPPVAVTDDFEGNEAQPYEHFAAWTDPNPDDIHNVTIDWGDGSPTEPMEILNAVLGSGVARATHTYPDDGNYPVTITVCDQTNRCDTAHGTAIIHNLPPVVENDHYSLYEGRTLAMNVLANDSDVDADLPLTIATVTQTDQGLVTHDGTTITFEAPFPYVGPLEFTYSADDGDGGQTIGTVFVEVIDDLHPDVIDDRYNVSRYGSVTGTVVLNDSDPEDGNVMFNGIVQDPETGTLTIDANGTFTYTPDPGTFDERDKFVYEACDQLGQCDYATAWIDEVNCGEHGLTILHDTLLVGTASGLVHDEVEPRVVSYLGPGPAQTVHEANCQVVVPVEDAVDDVTGGAPP